jgi:hypothetical protein
VAAELKQDAHLNVTAVAGGFGELSVTVDGREAYATRFTYPRPSTVVKKVRGHLG